MSDEPEGTGTKSIPRNVMIWLISLILVVMASGTAFWMFKSGPLHTVFPIEEAAEGEGEAEGAEGEEAHGEAAEGEQGETELEHTSGGTETEPEHAVGGETDAEGEH